jgi:[ribosomal protein S5]-alanine N-acetyltransferase
MNIALETSRLILKPVAFSELDDILELRSDPEVMKYIGATKTKEEVLDFIQCGQGYYEQYGLDFFSVFEKDTGLFIGQAGLFHFNFDVNQPEIELAYRLNKKYWGKGYAIEIAKALIDYGFSQLSLSKIIADVHPENEGSQKILEKVGMICCGTVRHKEFPETPFYLYQIFNPSFVDETGFVS